MSIDKTDDDWLDFSVVMTKHFMERSKNLATKFPGSRFFNKLDKFAKLASKNMNRECMVRLRKCKIIFVGRRNKDDYSIQLIFITAMPQEYKHNIQNKSKTINLGVMH